MATIPAFSTLLESRCNACFIQYVYTYTYIHIRKQTDIHTYIYFLSTQLKLQFYFMYNFTLFRRLIRHMSYNTWKIYQGIFGMLFLSNLRYFAYCHLVLSFQHIIQMAWTQNLSVQVHIKLFAGTVELLNHRILMMEYYSDRGYVQ